MKTLEAPGTSTGGRTRVSRSEEIRSQVQVDTGTPAVRKAKQPRETMEYAAMMRRCLAKWVTRLADDDLEDLAELVVFGKEVEDAIAAAVTTKKAQGVSCARLGAAFGTSRQNIHQRFGG